MTLANDSLPQPTDPAYPIQVADGAEFTIVLEANHTTGYSWALQASPRHPGVAHVGTDYQTAPHAVGMTGFGGWEVWTFRAQGRHRTTLTFHYRRPFERTAPPAEVVTFKVVCAGNVKRET